MRCDEVMTSEVEFCTVGETVVDAARKMRTMNIGFLPVCQSEGTVVGLLTDRDLVLRVLAENRSAETRVEEVMTEEVVSCLPSDELARAEDLMRTNQKQRVVCIDETGRLAGVISLADIAQFDTDARTGALLSDVSEREVSSPH